MSQQSQLLQQYRDAIANALRVAPIDEQSLYASHVQALERLGSLLTSGSSPSAVASIIASERRAFGWSFLPGSHGKRVESAFHILASLLEEGSPEAEHGA